MYGDGPDDQELRDGWHDFCEKLKQAGDVVFRDTAPSNAVTRATGMRQLARNISLALQLEFENRDPRYPEILHYFDPLRKQGGDNTDALYVGAPVNGTDTYRVSGYRGTAAYFAVTVLEDGNTPWGGAVVGTLIDDDLHVEEDGSFELVISPREHPGNWIRSSPGTYRLTFRQFFADWESEDPMVAVIEREGAFEAPAPLTAQALGDGLRRAADWIDTSVTYWADMLDKWQAQPGEFVAYGEFEDNAIDFTPGGAPLIAWWDVPRDEVMLIRVTPPKASYWAVEFGSYWWESMDYRRRLCSLNHHHGVLEEDGSLLMVIAHEDPGLPNWLDPSGHEQGYVTVRWIKADGYPRPVAERVPIEELESHLPPDVRRITEAEREAQLRARRRGVIKRFGT
ncbi:MAG: DUF1214 domain-containing protein [Myxococcota bacterium]|jgi:hypothetical protein|nr:DUF1214 domain-containing protein [Myxococcota bacterium]